MIFPKISERRGRRVAIIAAVALSGVSMLFLSFSSHIEIFIVLFFIAGVGLNGFQIILFVYITEVSAIRFRNNSSVILLAVGATAQVFVAPISYYFSYWRYMIWVIAIPFLLISLIFWKTLDETPRFLVSRKRFKEAKELLAKISV